MTFKSNAAGNSVKFENGTSEELSYKDWQAMLRRQLMAKVR
jgi:hypothetical protein